MSSRTSSRSTLTMVPSTMSPSLKYLIVWSMAARKSSSDPMSLTATCGVVWVGAAVVARRAVDASESERASRLWWDADADDYLAEHGRDIGDADFVWCPEGLREADARLLGDVTGLQVLEVGCGSAPCARWLAAQGAHPVALDLSAAMLRHAAALGAATRLVVPLVQAGAERLPFTDASFDAVCSAFGA